jgi:UDP-2,3-diacylglucosamine pyrophosphatase LpxH
MPDFPDFDEVHVISDLHMGGEKDFQVFDLGVPLARVIDHLTLRQKKTAKSLVLVINGDMVDFLAEPKAKAFDPGGAIKKLERIAKDKAFKPVFEALQRFTGGTGRTLAVTLGNHDLELCLPPVKKKFLELLVAKGAPPSDRQNIRLAFDGGGFRCQVGDRNVLAVHGNDVDLANLTDYERLRRIARDWSFGQVSADWVPNAGSRLVVEVINKVKEELPIVDLLKPELEAALPMVLAIRPSSAKRIPDLAFFLGRLVVDGIRRVAGLLAVDEDTRGEPRSTGLLDQGGLISDSMDKEDLLAGTEKWLRMPIDPASLADLETEKGLLGIEKITETWDVMTKRMSRAAVRFLYDRYADSPLFDLKYQDKAFRDLDAQVGAEIHFLVTGHTHLARDLSRRGGGKYLNTGTWIPLILPNSTAYPLDRDGKGSDELLTALGKGRRDLMADSDLVQRRPCVGQVIKREDGAVVGRLLDLSDVIHSPSLGGAFENDSELGEEQ